MWLYGMVVVKVCHFFEVFLVVVQEYSMLEMFEAVQLVDLCEVIAHYQLQIFHGFDKAVVLIDRRLLEVVVGLLLMQLEQNEN